MPARKRPAASPTKNAPAGRAPAPPRKPTPKTKPAAKGATKSGAAAAAARAPVSREAGAARFWLVKSEPDAFSWDDLERSPGRTTCWDGVRNYQARNFMRDGMRPGDLVLFYHSNAEPPAVVGICAVAREAYPDHTAFDVGSPYFDERSDPAAPTWLMVDLRAVERFARPVTLPAMREEPALAGMELLRRGSRLSVQPVEPAHWDIVARLGRGR